MNRKTITVESKPKREGQKSRSFSVELLAYVLANDLWELGAGAKERSHRPVFMAYAGTEQASRAFSANLRLGRPAVVECTSSITTRFEIPRSAGFRYETASQAGAHLTLAYLPSVCGFQPTRADCDDISFLCLPPTWWVDEQAQALASAMGRDAREAAVAAYFVAYLDQRSPLPIANDLTFHLQLYRAAREETWCQASSGTEWNPGQLFHIGLESLGFETAVHCKVDHPTFAEFLKSQTAANLPQERRPTMARPESIALAGYFPTPCDLLPSLASLVRFERQDRLHVLVDPCAGDGAAIAALRDRWFPRPNRDVAIMPWSSRSSGRRAFGLTSVRMW